MAKTVLIVDDELDIQSSLAFALKDEGYEVFTATLPREAELILSSQSIDIALFDVWFPEGDGIELLKSTRVRYPSSVVVMMSGHGNIELALKAIRLGAYDFLEKPLELEKVLLVLRNASDAQNLRDQNRRLSHELIGSQDFIGQSPSVHSLKTSIERAAAPSSHVLILGENGTGKELVSQLLHRQSPRSDEPFIAINCAAIPEHLIESELFGHEKGAFTGATSRHIGRFEQAGKGTLFLDEIGELSTSAQGKFLRVIEERKFERLGGRSTVKCEARILAATNRDLQSDVKAGRFREDLYFRLKVLSITVPPLRDRREDIVLLCNHFLKLLSFEYRRSLPEVSAELLSWFESYDWPGNVRELKNLLERMLIMNPETQKFTLATLPDEMQSLSLQSIPALDMQIPKSTELSLRDLRAQFEKRVIEERLESFNGNVTRAAESLGIERAHLHRKLKAYGLTAAVPVRGDS